MSAWAYYNEFDPYAAQWLRNLMAAGLIPAGEVDERSIVDVQAADLRPFRQRHFFAGIGGWPLAARAAGWPDDREIWTGSPPCQPFSVAGQGKAQADDRHLWPYLFDLIRACRPAVFMGEQVAAAVGKNWFDGVLADLESIGYAGRGAVIPACAVNAPHRRDRLWFVAHTEHRGCEGRNQARHHEWPGAVVPSSEGACVGCGNGWDDCICVLPGPFASALEDSQRARGGREIVGGETGGSEADGPTGGPSGSGHGDVGHADSNRRASRIAPTSAARYGRAVEPDGGDLAMADGEGLGSPRWDAAAVEGRAEPRREAIESQRCGLGAWDGAGWVLGRDGKHRRTPEPGIRLLAHGVPARVGRLRAYGNAIVPQVATEVIGAYLDCMPEVAGT